MKTDGWDITILFELALLVAFLCLIVEPADRYTVGEDERHGLFYDKAVWFLAKGEGHCNHYRSLVLPDCANAQIYAQYKREQRRIKREQAVKAARSRLDWPY